MRLLTHNFLRSNVKGTEKGYPLHINATSIQYEETPYNPEFIKSLIHKIDYSALLQASKQIAPLLSDPPLPELPEQLDESATTAESLHKVLLDVHVMEGELICPDTGRKFPINDGIPNMILHEDEL